MAHYHESISLTEKEEIEIQFWKNSPIESPGAETIENLVNKFCEARVFLAKLDYFHQHFEQATSILELGAGQGWASCIVKHTFPDKQVVASDISQYAIASVSKWERIFQATLDQTIQCRSYEIPHPDSSLDLIFCFEAAHHFVRHRRTLKEIYRVLKPGGICLYLHEPTCRKYLHRLAHARVNRNRPEVPEDVLVYPKLVKISQQVGLEAEVRFDPTTLNRGAVETIYYLLLQKLPLAKFYLPCSADFLFKKP